MKKSKFLQNSKDMLTRSFNPAKCKTSLRLAGSRLKLLRNKKEVQVKQMKKEIAKLLESGQDQTARIRVEHVIREEKMMAAYDLLEIYCELIVARLPIIESQKNCPIDLKEAIASVIFASPRCGDVPELLDVRKHFTAKYGKDFTTAAIELRPQCGVGRMLVEKLSAMAPDGQTKIKILSAIAEEHNIKWDPMSFEEKDSVPPSDLLNGPSTFEKGNKLYVEPPRFEAADVEGLPGSNQLHSSASNFSQQDPSTSVGAEKFASAQTSGVSKTCQPKARLPGDERAQLFQGDNNTSSLGRQGDRQKWNMEFKDAASAAQAAAESAERASMAARAAAELSSHGRIMRQYSTESHKSDVYNLKDDRPEMHPNSEVSCEQFSEESANGYSTEHTRLLNEKINGMKPNYSKTAATFNDDDHLDSEEYSRSAFLKSKAPTDNDSLDHGVQVEDKYSHKNSLEEASRGEMSMKKQSFKHEAETVNSWTEKAENFQEERTGKQQSVSSSRSHSSISDDLNIFANPEHLKSENDDGEDPFVGIGYGGALQTSSHEHSVVVFDKFDSDSDDHRFDIGPAYDEQDSEFHLPSFIQKSPEHLSRSPRYNSVKIVESISPPLFFTKENSSPDFSENLTSRDDSELRNFAPVTFDDSDGPTSESDEDTNTRHIGVEDSGDLLRKHSESGQSVGSLFEDKSGRSVGSLFKDEEHSVFDRNQFSLTSDDELKSEKMNWERNTIPKFDADSPEKLSPRMPSAEQLALGPEESHMDSNNIGNEFGPESGEGLNIGKLTGGFRQKGHNGLPFLKNRLDGSSSVKKETETVATTTRSASPPAVERPEISTRLDRKKSTSKPDLHSESESDSSEEEEPLQKSSGHKQGKYTLTAVKEVKKKSSLGASNSIFDSDNSDLDEDPPKKSLTWKSRPQTGISRRTKASPSSSRTNSYSRMHIRSETPDSDAGMDRKPTTSYNSKTQKKSESQMRNSGKWENYEQPTSAKVAAMPGKSNFGGPPEQGDSAEATPVMMQESKVELRSEVHDSDASLGRKPSNSYSTETRQEFQSLTRNSGQLGNIKKPIPAKVASRPTNSIFLGTPEKSNSGKATSMTVQEPKISQEPSPVEELSSPQQKSETIIGNGSPPTETLNKTSSNKDESTKRASHVHPKLPDYDTLVQSLRKNRS